MTRPSGVSSEHRPGLDGLRAVAVVLVLLFHLDRLPGGFLGVDLFFALSGWLITWRLVASARTTGSIDLRRFWSARVRRLAPASLAVIMAVLVVWPLTAREVPGLGRDAVFAALWAANWGTITAGGDYWARFGDPSPLTHFWSLAIEEQFYAVWPVVVLALVAMARCGARSAGTPADPDRAARRAARWIAGVAAAAGALSIAVMAIGFDPSDRTATYMNTFARLHGLLIGATFGALTPLLADGRVRHGRRVRWALVPAVAVAGAMVATAGASSDWLYRWGFPLFAIAAVIVVVAVADGAGGSWLACEQLRWLGDRSYGIYLWHWPIFLLLDPPTLGGAHGAGRIVGDVGRIAITLAVAHLSFELLETPIRARRRLHGARAPLAVLGALTAVVVLAALQPAPAQQASESVVTLAPLTSPATSDEPAGDSTGPADATTATTAAARPPRVLVAGDSTAVHLAEELVRVASDDPSIVAIGSAAFGGCGLSVADDGRRHEMTTADGAAELVDLSPCVAIWERLPERVRDEGYDTVLVSIGPWDGTDLHLADGSVVSVADPDGRSLVASAYHALADRLLATGVEVVWILPPDVLLQWGAVESPMNDPRRWEALRSIVAELPVRTLDLTAWLTDRDLLGPEGRPDGVHLAPDVLRRVVAELVLPAVAA